MSIGKEVAKLWPFLYTQDGRQPLSILDFIKPEIAPFDPPTQKTQA